MDRDMDTFVCVMCEKSDLVTAMAHTWMQNYWEAMEASMDDDTTTTRTLCDAPHVHTLIVLF